MALWAYKTRIKTSTGFTPFQLVYGLEVTLPIECEIPSLKRDIELLPNTATMQEHFGYLKNIDETRQDGTMDNEVHKR